VAAGVATIEVKTQVLSPVDDPRIRSQLVQRLQFGTIRFDVDAGRVLSKQMDTDEIVIGFQGADSIMQYLARFTEEPVEEKSESTQGSSNGAAKATVVASKAGSDSADAAAND
jgi:hypothetical protein